MKKWNQLKCPLLIALILLAFTALRIAVPAMPYDWRFLLYARYLLVLLSEELLHSRWGLWDLMLYIGAVACVTALPCLRELKIGNRLVLCALVVLLVFVACTPMVSGAIDYANDAYDALQDRQFDEKVEANNQQIREFIRIADEAIWYSKDTYMSDRYRTAFPELLASEKWSDGQQHSYITDTMMIDYDSMRIAFAYHYVNLFELRSFDLEEGQIPESSTWSHSVELKDPGATLTLYFDYREGQVGNGSTMTCIALTMADGSVYTAVNITDPDTGYNYFVGHPAGGSYERIEDFLERKEQ